MLCPCNSQLGYQDCCQPLHTGNNKAASAEALMRSRYCAYALQQYQYLIDSHHPSTRAELNTSSLSTGNADCEWLALQILSSNEGEVSFRAFYRQKGQLNCLHEDSRFVLEQQQWYYLNGSHNPKLATLPKRKDPCFCGSGKKFKHCHDRQL